MPQLRSGLGSDEDAFGRALWNFHLHGEGVEIIERDDGFIEAMDLADSIYFAAFDEWPSHERQVLKHVRGVTLDVGCGAGRVALHLQERGIEVVAIDVSGLAVRLARARGVLDVRHLAIKGVNRKLGRFDTIVMMGNNFGLLGTHERASSTLRRIRGSVPDGGRLIASTVDPYLTKEPAHLAYHRLNRRRGRPGGEVRIRLRYKDSATRWFDFFFTSQRELTRIVRDTGWEIEKLVDGPAGAYGMVLRTS